MIILIAVASLLIQGTICTIEQIEPFKQYCSSTSSQMTLYAGTSPLGLDIEHQYSIVYSAARQQTPQIAICFSGYKQISDLARSVVRIWVSQNTFSQFTVTLKCSFTALVYKVQISYISIEDSHEAIFVKYFDRTSSTLNNVRSGTGHRQSVRDGNYFTESNGKTLNNDLAKNKIITYLTGFEIEAASQFSLQLYVIIVNSITYREFVATDFNCKITKVSVLNIFINTGKWENANPAVFLLQQSIEYLTGNSSQFTRYYSSMGNKLLGLNSWSGSGLTSSSEIFFQFQVAHSVSMLQMSIVDNLTLYYLFIAEIDCPLSHPYYKNTTRSLCVNQCGSRETASPSLSICAACSSLCLSCYGISSNCTSCAAGYEIKEGRCQALASAEPKKQSKLYLLSLLAIIPIALITSSIHFFEIPFKESDECLGNEHSSLHQLVLIFQSFIQACQ